MEQASIFGVALGWDLGFPLRASYGAAIASGIFPESSNELPMVHF